MVPDARAANQYSRPWMLDSDSVAVYTCRVADGMTLEELAEAAGVPSRTVRYYVSVGLLPSPGGRGRSASYGDEHLQRLRLARSLAERRVPLSDIAERLRALSLADVRDLLAEEEQRTSALAKSRVARPKEYLAALLEQATKYAPNPSAGASVPAPRASPAPAAAPPATHTVGQAVEWKRWELASGVELHVRADAERRHQSLIERILRLVGRR